MIALKRETAPSTTGIPSLTTPCVLRLLLLIRTTVLRQDHAYQCDNFWRIATN